LAANLDHMLTTDSSVVEDLEIDYAELDELAESGQV
jgi:hypothetical protein